MILSVAHHLVTTLHLTVFDDIFIQVRRNSRKFQRTFFV